MPFFSIVIPAYNNEKYLGACIESLINQSFEDWEAVVVIDCSPDASLELATGYADRDSRVRIINKKVNEGTHLARRSGVSAATGEYIYLLDADDQIPSGALLQLAQALKDTDADMLHFGINVIGVDINEHDRLAFERYINRPNEDLCGLDICLAAFDSDKGFKQDWRITQRVYSAALLKSAFEAMTGDRLGRAQDGYEYFVTSALAKKQITRNDIVALDYFYGRGENADSKLDCRSFSRSALHFQKTIDAIRDYASSRPELSHAAESGAEKLYDLLMNDWLVRVPSDLKRDAAFSAAECNGPAAIAAQLMRLSRDAAYGLSSSGAHFDETSECALWFAWADELAAQATEPLPADFSAFRAEAAGHLHDLECANGWCASSQADAPTLACRSDFESQDIRIFVTTHKDVNLYHSSILQPVQVGAKSPRRRLLWAYQDDSGENIADKNAMYCELTTQYWAWKNADAKYYGFCHYRRYFDFSDVEHTENVYGEVMDGFIDWDSQARYGLDDASIARAVEGWDIVTTGIKDLNLFPEKYTSPYDHYLRAPYLKIADLERVLSILKELHPDYAEDADAYMAGHLTCFCNMYVMRKELFFRYCEWMFPILERFVDGWDTSKLSHETLRTPGHLSERLFNIWLLHEKRVNPELKHKQVQCVHFEHPEHVQDPLLEPVDGHGKPVVPVVFAADNNYVPMTTTTIYSMLANASKDCFYDVVILEKDFSDHNKTLMTAFFSRFENACVRFLNVSGMVRAYNLQTSNEHISVETYYRFLIQKVLPGYDKVLYLDSDLIIKGDVSKLFAIDLGDNLLAAARDVDYLGNLNMNDGERMAYTNEVLKLANPYDYFQAGVLLLNTAQMRALYPFQKWLEIASEPKYIYDDQDILNAHCQGRVVFLDNAWNVMNDCFGRIKTVFSFAPADVYDDFMRAYADPLIVHYAGGEKPWKPGHCDMAELYWEYARETPFYEKLLDLKYSAMVESLPAARAAGVHDRAISEDSPLRKVFDGVLPQGSGRREAAKSIVRTLRGRS